ncbi:MAG: hemagglutinin repeat-containing protein [Gammaproteobacteria bacterium]|nr:hemagglutinin repeat-containing protein [Gammaproteobacteria bacterium]
MALWSDSKTTVAGATVVKAHDVVIRGDLVTQQPEESPDKKIGTPSIIGEARLDISSKATISGDEDLTVVADVIGQSGQVDLQAKFCAKGRQFDNNGPLTADSMYFGFDDAVVNRDMISARSIVCHSNLMNILGRIYAQETMSTSGMASINMGLIAANNYINDSFFSLNAGLIAPNFSADPKYIFSWTNLMSSARTLALMWAPMHASGIHLAFTVPGFVMSAANLYQSSDKLSWSGLCAMKRHEYIPIFCQAKSLLLLGHGMATHGNAAYYGEEAAVWKGDYSRASTDYYAYANEWQTTLRQTDWKQAGYRVTQSLAGSYTDTSVFHANVGASLAVNTANSSWMHANFGEEHSLFSHNINTSRLYNYGHSTGGEASFAATHIENQGVLSGSQQFCMRANTVNNEGGHIKGAHASVSIEELAQKGELVMQGGRVHISAFRDTKHAHTALEQVLLEGATLDSLGALAFKHTQVQETEHFITSSDNTFSTDDVSIKAPDFHANGTTDYQHHLSIQADSAIFGHGSVVNGQRTDAEKLFVPSETEGQSEFKPEHVLTVEASKVVLGGQLAGGDYTQIQGQKVGSDAAASKTDVLTIEDSAQVVLTHGSIQAKQAGISGEAKLDGCNIDIDAGMIASDKGHLSIDNSSYTGHTLQIDGAFQFDHSAITLDKLQQHGHLDGTHSTMKVGVFADDTRAKTTLEEITLQGKTLDISGSAALGRAHIQEDEHVHAAQSSKLKTDDVGIETGEFVEDGMLDYDHHLSIKAKKAILSQGSVVNGQQTAEDELFVPASGNDSDVKPTLRPEHVLIIEASKTVLEGALTGGDYTQIQGKQIVTDDTQTTTKCDELIVGEFADIALKHGSIAAKSGKIDGKMSLDDFSVAIDDSKIGPQHGLSLKSSSMKGDSLYSSGILSLTASQAQIDAIQLANDAHPELIDSHLITHSLQDDSQLGYSGQSGVVADDYQHSGYVSRLPSCSDKKSTFYVQAKTAELTGGGDLDSAVYQIDHFSDAAQFVAGIGRYATYGVNQSLTFATEDDISLSNPIARDCDIGVKAKSIGAAFDYDKAHQLSFTSTQGDITLTKSLRASNVYATSAGHIFNNGTVIASDKVFYDAQGNIVNSGAIAAGKYTQLLAKGDVTNLCEDQVYQGQFDTRHNYRAGLIAGGTGEDTDGTGLYVKAEGQVVSDASDFISQGSNYIEGLKGVRFDARYHTYISSNVTERERPKSGNEFEKIYVKAKKKMVHTITTGTDMGISHIHSANGRNIIRSGEGAVTSTAAQFSSPGGTDVYARGNVQLFSLQTSNQVHQWSEHRFHSFQSERDYVYQNSQPTLFIDNGTTRIHSAEGNVDARGAYFIGGGDLEIKAKQRILLGVDILNHDMTQKTQSLQFSVPGMAAWDTYKQGGSAWTVGAAFDPTLAKVNAFHHSQSGLERAISAANLGIDLGNAGNSLLRGIGQGSITDELLARYGLGVAGQLAPSITASLSQSKTKQRFQTQGQGGIDRGGNVTLEAGEGVDLENGVQVRAGKDLEINAPELRAHAAELHSSVKQTVQTETLAVAGLEGVQSAGVSHSQTKTSSTTYINAALSAGGNVHLHHNDGAMQTVELDGANIHAQTLDAKIDTLTIRDKQDISHTKTISVSVATSGQFGFYHGKSSSCTTQQYSGIDVVAGINTDGHGVQVHETHMIGGKITTDGKNHFKTDKLSTETLTDVQQSKGFGVSGNVHDVQRLLGGNPSNQAGEQTFATATVQIDKENFVASQVSVIHGTGGTVLEAQTFEGQVETNHDSGMRVHKDSSVHLQADVPVTNKSFLAQASQNVHTAEEKISAFLHPKHPDPVDFGRPEPIVPVDENKEEASLGHRRRRKYEDDSGQDPMVDEQEKSTDVPMVLSSDEEAVIEKTVAKAHHEYQTMGKLSDTTRQELTSQVVAAVTKTAKAGGSVALEKMLGALGPEYAEKTLNLLMDSNSKGKAWVKIYMGKTGLMLDLFANAGLAYLDDSIPREDVLKHAVADVVVDAGIGVVLNIALRGASVPVGAALTLLGISDSFYDEKKVEDRLDHGLDNLFEARQLYRDGHGFAGWGLESAAREQIAASVRAQAGHQIASIPGKISDKIVSMFHKQPPTAEPKEASQLAPCGTRVRAASI